MAIELRQLEHFAAVADELNFSAAARRLFITQQALSRSIRQLEREVGTELFQRTTRRVELTDAGRAMLPQARRALNASRRAVATARAVGQQTPQAVTVDLSSASLRTPAVLLERFRREHAGIAVHQVEIGAAQGLRALLDGSLDVLLGMIDSTPDGLVREEVREEPIRVVVGRQHRLAAFDQVPVRELAGERLLLPPEAEEPAWVALVEQLCSDAGFEPQRSPEVTRGSLAAGALAATGECVVPTADWVTEVPGTVVLPLVDPSPVMPWTLVTRRGDTTAGVVAFRSTVDRWITSGDA